MMQHGSTQENRGAPKPAAQAPKDVAPDQAAARDLAQRDIQPDDVTEREEALLDEAIELTFPASDPISVPSYVEALEKSKWRKERANPPTN